MPIYHKLGEIPPKRHTIFQNGSGKLRYEELFGTIGFSGMSSLLYHVTRPTQISSIGTPIDIRPTAAVDNNIHPRKLDTMSLPTKGDDYLSSRQVLFFNAEVEIISAYFGAIGMDYFYKNSSADELVFIHYGKGLLKTFLGNIPFEDGDYLLIPRGTIHQFFFETDDNRILITSSRSPIYTPKRYRNHFGQLLEHSPYCERDYKLPNHLETHDKSGQFLIKIAKNGFLHPVTYSRHPFSVVGWDGYNFPYGFSIHNFEPIVGRIHQPPPVHQTFESARFVVCSFCPRLYDWHPKSIPAPYHHSNIDSDELLYYVDGDFMSRNDIGPGIITLHPAGVPHGPHPGAVERSIGKEKTDELAVMIDTFDPLRITTHAQAMDDGTYHLSWLHDE